MSELEDRKPADCIARLVAYNGSLQIAHWLADTVTNEHKALGELYESMVDFTDEFAEVYMGKYGVPTFPKDAKIEDITKDTVGKGLELVEMLQGHFVTGEDDDLLNILADMSAKLNKTAYLLKVKVETKKEEKEQNELPTVVIAVRRQMNKKS